MKVSDLGENGLLDLIRTWSASASKQVPLGVGDDAAILSPSGNREIVVSTDAYLDGVHFTRDIFAPDDIGHKAMAAALSDLAAMGAEGIAAFVDLTVREDEDIDFLRGVYQGMARIAGSCNVAIAGGDTTRGEFSLGLTVVGFALGAPIRRDGASPGDLVFVSGELGKSEAGRLLLNDVDYVALGPIFPTRHAAFERPALGTAAVARAAAGLRVPLVAIGGITLDNTAEVLAAGAASVAVMGDLMAAGDLASRVAAYLSLASPR